MEFLSARRAFEIVVAERICGREGRLRRVLNCCTEANVARRCGVKKRYIHLIRVSHVVHR